MSSDLEITFATILEKFDSNLWGHHILVSDVIANQFITDAGDRRVVCTLNNKIEFQCALMPKAQRLSKRRENIHNK